jgi:hypothetical protein
MKLACEFKPVQKAAATKQALASSSFFLFSFYVCVPVQPNIFF